MKDLQEKGPLIEEIWDLLLSQFGVAASEELQQAITKCSLQQAGALEFLQSKQQRVCHPGHQEQLPEHHHRQLTDFLNCELRRLASYSLLLNNTIQHTNGNECKEILEDDQAELRQAENHRGLQAYQQCLDARSLRKGSRPLARHFLNLDLTEHHIIQEGLLQLRISKKKTVGTWKK